MQKNKFSIWLRPSQTQIDEFTHIISKLSHHYGTQPFPPHITLCSGINIDIDSITSICKSVSSEYQAFDVPLHQIEFTDAYYRNFFILAEKTDLLTNLRKQLLTLLGLEQHEEFMPHVSLLYGNIKTTTKFKLKEKLDSSYSSQFNSQRIDLYNTTDDLPNWFLVESFNFLATKK